ncbi:restriction endonuclease [Micromonospora sp. NBC_01699]|uniref:restriction endonuclease n=1 Tax=Micromonospora sp. NBC_01699 TaxID=2975984 RepID=UPI002E320781|nr:restriction endonuclease [Micromonospora sp. NBC_01699]
MASGRSSPTTDDPITEASPGADGARSEAVLRSEAVRVRIRLLDRVLLDRDRGLRRVRRRLTDTLGLRGTTAFDRALLRELAGSNSPGTRHGACAARICPPDGRLLLEYEYPPPDVIPAATGYHGDPVRPEPRPATEIGTRYAYLLARITLRVLAGAFDATPASLVDRIVLNGYRTTGPTRTLLVSTDAIRDSFERLDLDAPAPDPVTCLRLGLGARVSPQPYASLPVEPVADVDLSDCRFVEQTGPTVDLSGRPDLRTLPSAEYAQVIRCLFEALGWSDWTVRESSGADVDALAIDPVGGGVRVVQAWRHGVGAAGVQDLVDTLDNWSAGAGVLVSAGPIGTADRARALGDGRIEVVDGGRLRLMLREHLVPDLVVDPD